MVGPRKPVIIRRSNLLSTSPPSTMVHVSMFIIFDSPRRGGARTHLNSELTSDDATLLIEAAVARTGSAKRKGEKTNFFAAFDMQHMRVRVVLCVHHVISF